MVVLVLGYALTYRSTVYKTGAEIRGWPSPHAKILISFSYLKIYEFTSEITYSFIFH